MKDILTKIISDTISITQHDAAQDTAYDHRRASLALFFLLTLALITLVFGLLNLVYFHFLLLAAAELVTFAIVFAALIDLKEFRRVARTAWITVAAFGALSIFFYCYITAKYSGSVWLLLFPMIAFFLLGTRKGTPVYIGFVGIILSLILLNNDRWAALESPATVSNIVGSLVAFGMIIYYQERTREKAYDKIVELANTDGLTGLVNRRHFIETFANAKNELSQQNTLVSLLLVDIDHFKEINDSYGHLIGDYVIQQVSCRIASMVRAGDALGRLGGEEFGVLLIGCDRTHAVRCAEQIREAVSERPIVHGEHHIPATVSVGVASGRMRADAFHNLFAQADERLYTAKTQGRDRVAAYI